MPSEIQKLQVEAEVAEVVGADDLAQGAAELEVAREAAGLTVGMAVAGTSDVTRGEDMVVAAVAIDEISGVVARKGVVDTIEGEQTLQAAEDVNTLAQMARSLSAADLDRGMVLAGMSGEMTVAADVVHLIGMPVLTAFLRRKSRQLRGLAVNEIGRAMAAAAVSEGIDDLRDQLAGLGMAEVAEGMTEIVRSGELEEAAGAIAVAGAERAATGRVELELAKEAAETATDFAAAGVSDVAEGSMEVGAARGAEAAVAATKKGTRRRAK